MHVPATIKIDLRWRIGFSAADGVGGGGGERKKVAGQIAARAVFAGDQVLVVAVAGNVRIALIWKGQVEAVVSLSKVHAGNGDLYLANTIAIRIHKAIAKLVGRLDVDRALERPNRGVAGHAILLSDLKR